MIRQKVVGAIGVRLAGGVVWIVMDFCAEEFQRRLRKSHLAMILLAKYLDDVTLVTRIINKAYDLHIFPEQLKKAIITPIFKEGNLDEISNYRPISVLTIICKIFERSASNQMAKYFLDKQKINPHQHAYQPAYSTTNLLS